MTIDLGEKTVLPCGRYCGMIYQIPELVEPVEIQREAIKNGWKVWTNEDGDDVLVCQTCVAALEGGTN